MSCCPNCSTNGFKEEVDFICEACGFKFIAVQEKESISILYCTMCGVHYSNGCSRHSQDEQQKKF
jgi:hypothetical protein